MGEKTERGFTIIEVMLFLAVTAFLMFALMGGWTISMNTQSYRDSLRSTAQFLENQFTATTNVTNMRDANKGCNKGDAKIIDGNIPRGQTDCVIIGKYLAVEKGKITTYTILGTDEPSTAPANPTDKQVLQSYNPTIASDSAIPSDEFTIPWQAELYAKQADDSKLPLEKGIAIIRSPKNGLVRTYHGAKKDLTASNGNQLKDWLDATTTTTDALNICFDPGAVIAGDNQMITLAANAASAQAVSVKPECTT